jgi:hypothetical protein
MSDPTPDPTPTPDPHPPAPEPDPSLIPKPAAAPPPGDPTPAPTPKPGDPTPTPAAEPKTPPTYLSKAAAEKFFDPATGNINIEKMAESFEWGLTKLGGFTGAPEADAEGKVHYKMTLPDGVTGDIDPESEDWGAFEQLFAENHCSQEFVDKLVGAQAHVFGSLNKGRRDAEMALLRGEGYDDAKLAQIGEFYAGLCETEEQLTEIMSLWGSAQGVKVFDRLRNGILKGKLEKREAGDGPMTGPATEGQLDEMYNRKTEFGEPLYLASGQEGDTFRAEIRAKAKKIAGEV